MHEIIDHKIHYYLSLWIDFVCRHAGKTIIAAIVTTILLLYYFLANISVNTDTSDMLSPELPFRQNSIALTKSFPQFSDNIVVVLDGPNADLVNQAADLFVDQLETKPNLFSEIFDPAGAEFFRKNGLLYLSESKLEKLSDRLITAQPFLNTLWKDPSLSGLFDLISLLLKEGADKKEFIGLAELMLGEITNIIIAQNKNIAKQLSWSRLISGYKVPETDTLETRIIVLKPKINFSSLKPGSDTLSQLRIISQNLNLTKKFQTRLRLTGSLPLAKDEMSSVVDGLGVAGALSITLVVILLFWGLKSAKLVMATFLTLICGLVWTAGFTTFTIGTFNLISVAFAVLFIGLSVDFGIHFALCYYRNAISKEETITTLHKATHKVGGSLILTTATAAIGFYSFLPTEYVGLAELGFIAGSGMFIALFTNLTILPALIYLMPPNKIGIQRENSNKLSTLFVRYKYQIIIIAGMLAVVSLYFLPKMVFDFDPFNLKNTKSESVSTFLDLKKTGNSNPYSITVLAENLNTADSIALQAKKLPLVQDAITLSNLIPPGQSVKLAILENLSYMIGPSLSGSYSSNKREKRKKLSSAQLLQTSIKEFRKHNLNSSLAKTIGEFNVTLDRLLENKDADERLADLEKRLLAGLHDQLIRLKNSMEAEEITKERIPTKLFSRYVSSEGKAKVEIIPRRDLRVQSNLLVFVAEVRSIAPQATGTPVIILEAGKTVVNAFIKAVVISLILIIVLVVSVTRSFREIILILTPLVLASMLTIATSVILNQPFNFANVIVLPLLFGLGIASSIHLVVADRNSSQDLFATSTPRAIIFSALTTIASFGSIALSSHPGTSSMGILLTLALILSLICTLIILPALLSVWPKTHLK